MKTGRLLILTGLLFISGLSGFFLYRVLANDLQRTETAPIGMTDVAMATKPGTRRPDFSLMDVAQQSRQVSEWDGKVIVINFWATWCPPCRKEIPEFIRLQDEYGEKGVQFLGVAIDELGNVREFVNEMGINYPILVGEDDAMAVARSYGNVIGALPYTAIVDRQGNITLTHQGELLRSQLEPVLLSLL